MQQICFQVACLETNSAGLPFGVMSATKAIPMIALQVSQASTASSCILHSFMGQEALDCDCESTSCHPETIETACYNRLAEPRSVHDWEIMWKWWRIVWTKYDAQPSWAYLCRGLMAKQHLDETQHPESIILRDPSVEVNGQATYWRDSTSRVYHISWLKCRSQQSSSILVRLNSQMAKQHLDETQHPESIILHDSSVEVKQPSNILARPRDLMVKNPNY